MMEYSAIWNSASAIIGGMAIRPPPKLWRPSAGHLLIETAAQRKSENISPVLSGEMMRSILNGTRYPRNLMVAVLIHIRAAQGM